MIMTQPEEIREFLLSEQLIDSRDPIQVTPLSGGVSNEVWKIDGLNFSWVMKQSLPKLKVQSDWLSDINRIEREVLALQLCSDVLPAETYPEFIHYDPNNHIYIMKAAPENFASWKDQLMKGKFDPVTAGKVGAILKTLHENSKNLSPKAVDDLKDMTFFRQLRVEPFYEYIKETYVKMSSVMDEMITDITCTPTCFVHGDFTPKNILVNAKQRVMILDYEVAHWGNPVFDVASCASHLILKGVGLNKSSKQLVEAFLSKYGKLPTNLLGHIGMMLLSRVDGKSPVDYLTSEQQKQNVRALALRLIEIKDGSMSDLISNLMK